MANVRERIDALRQVAQIARKIKDSGNLNERARLSKDLERASRKASEANEGPDTNGNGHH